MEVKMEVEMKVEMEVEMKETGEATYGVCVCFAPLAGSPDIFQFYLHVNLGP